MSARTKGATGQKLLFRLVDSTTGLAKSGIDVTTLKIQYERPGEAPSTATALTALAALTTAWTAFGAKEIDATNSKGVYRVDAPDAAFAAPADEVALSVSGTGIETATRLFDLLTVDLRITAGKLPTTTATGDGIDAAAVLAGMNSSQITGSVVDTSPTAASFKCSTNLSATDGFYGSAVGGSVLTFSGGANQGISREITGYVGATKQPTFAEPFPVAPANGDTFTIRGWILRTVS